MFTLNQILRLTHDFSPALDAGDVHTYPAGTRVRVLRYGSIDPAFQVRVRTLNEAGPVATLVLSNAMVEPTSRGRPRRDGTPAQARDVATA